jgi:hypothetical protein
VIGTFANMAHAEAERAAEPAPTEALCRRLIDPRLRESQLIGRLVLIALLGLNLDMSILRHERVDEVDRYTALMKILKRELMPPLC